MTEGLGGEIEIHSEDKNARLATDAAGRVTQLR
jgi:hypothetical protein